MLVLSRKGGGYPAVVGNGDFITDSVNNHFDPTICTHI
jgi:hypothetical protein